MLLLSHDLPSNAAEWRTDTHMNAIHNYKEELTASVQRGKAIPQPEEIRPSDTLNFALPPSIPLQNETNLFLPPGS